MATDDAGTTFLLIRHAESPWSEDEGRPLSPAGARDAEALAERLGARAIDAVYSSPSRRAVQTVAPIAERRGLAIAEAPDLRERALGSFRDVSFEEAVAATWADPDFAHPGGESNRAAQQRALGLVGDLARRHGSRTVALSTHGNLLALLLHGFDPRVGFAFWSSLAFPDAFELRVHGPGAATYRRIG
jgi:2,3-bisphosphoglycerate-dependent phosphoglycerate mutase